MRHRLQVVDFIVAFELSCSYRYDLACQILHSQNDSRTAARVAFLPPGHKCYHRLLCDGEVVEMMLQAWALVSRR